jgi:hypothetical protein
VKRCADLLARARANPASLRFAEACTLAECHGWVPVRQRGSHRIFQRPGSAPLLNLQDLRGMAKPYQVRQLLAAIDDVADGPCS